MNNVIAGLTCCVGAYFFGCEGATFLMWVFGIVGVLLIGNSGKV